MDFTKKGNKLKGYNTKGRETKTTIKKDFKCGGFYVRNYLSPIQMDKIEIHQKYK